MQKDKQVKKVIVDDFLTIEFVLGKLKDEWKHYQYQKY
jgi:hypothetical protein